MELVAFLPMRATVLAGDFVGVGRQLRRFIPDSSPGSGALGLDFQLEAIGGDSSGCVFGVQG
jgi:hypothetical protein